MKPTKPTISAADIPLLTIRSLARKQRAAKRKRLTKTKIKQMVKAQRATVRRKKADLALAAAKPPKPLGCQHPRQRHRGVCACEAIGTRTDDGTFVPTLFDIPPDYKPLRRYANQPDVPRPQARLCLQHKFLVEAFAQDDDKPVDFAHRRQCPVCGHANQEKVARTIQAWLSFLTKGTVAAVELGVSYHTFMQHCYYYRLDEKRAQKDNTRKLLLHIAEGGIGAKVSADVALKAITQLGKERGDVVENMDVRLAVKDYSEMSDEEYAEVGRKLAAKLAAEAAASKDGVP